MSALRLGTRGSALALTQSGMVRSALERQGHQVTVEVITTTGDREQTSPLSKIGGKGLFTRELDVALIEGRIDFAVHSLKDLPTELEAGLALAAVPEREDPRDVLVGPADARVAPTLQTLPPGARLGTSSLRRRALAAAFRPDIEILNVRGNLDTRVAKVDRGEYDAIVVAAAGLRRLGLAERITEALERTAWLPAPGQGALGVVARSGDEAVASALAALNHAHTGIAVRAERTMLAALGGGCQMPIAALGMPYDGGLRLWGLVASPDGTRVVRADATGSTEDPEELGARVAETLQERGASDILASIPSASVPKLTHP